jgi:hypothetical protein
MSRRTRVGATVREDEDDDSMAGRRGAAGRAGVWGARFELGFLSGGEFFSGEEETVEEGRVLDLMGSSILVQDCGPFSEITSDWSTSY